MFTSIPSLDPIVQCLMPAFTQPSFQIHIEVFLGWMTCLGKGTEYAAFQAIRADRPVSRKKRHSFDRFCNFFGRSAWTVQGLAYEVAVGVVVRLNPKGLGSWGQVSFFVICLRSPGDTVLLLDWPHGPAGAPVDGSAGAQKQKTRPDPNRHRAATCYPACGYQRRGCRRLSCGAGRAA